MFYSVVLGCASGDEVRRGDWFKMFVQWADLLAVFGSCESIAELWCLERGRNFLAVPYLLLAAKMLVSGNIQMMGIWRYKRVRVCPTFLVRICLCGSLNIKHKQYDSNVNNNIDMLRKVLWAVLWLRHSMTFMCLFSNVDFAGVQNRFITIHYLTILNCCMAMRDLWC